MNCWVEKTTITLFRSLGGILQEARWHLLSREILEIFLVSFATTKLYNCNHLQVKRFLPLLGLRRVVSQITVQHGLSTTGNRQRITPRQVHRECHSILQHHRYKVSVFLAGFCFSGYRYFFACLLLCYLWSMHLFFQLNTYQNN